MFRVFYNNKKTHKAYSFIEIIVAMLVFGVVSVGLILPYQESLSLTGVNQNIVSANSLARLYLKETELIWQNQQDFDNEVLPEINAKFTNNNKYFVTVSIESIATNDDGIDIVKRVNIDYQNDNNTDLINLFLDYNRPGSSN